MKSIISIILLFITNILAQAQIITSEVKVEPTNNTTSISGTVGIGTNSPTKLLHVRGNPEDENDRDILAYFEQSANSSEDAGIAIKGARNNSTRAVSFIDFDIFDNNEVNTTFTMAKIGSGKQSTSGENGNLRFFTNNGTALVEHMRINSNGNVGIKTSDPTYNLHVIGSIKGTSLHTDTQNWSDFVFRADYRLRTLEEVENYITKNKHLPEIPNETEVVKNGINLGEMDAKLLQKIEELTLYLIEQNKQNKAQQVKIEELERKIHQLENK